MTDQEREVIEAMKFELRFLENGGYCPPVHQPGRELQLFCDSPSCLNFALPARKRPCSECWLMQFVPAEQQGQAIPCWHITLNDRGDTVASLIGRGENEQAHVALESWWRKNIAEMEEAPKPGA